MLWTGTDEACGYGLVDKESRTTPLYHVKRLFAHYVRFGDWIHFPEIDGRRDHLLVICARGEDGRRSALLIHTDDHQRTVDLTQIDGSLEDCDRLLLLDPSTNGEIRQTSSRRSITFHGWGVAVITNAEA